MLKQVIRKGDKVRFARADEHPSADKRSFFVEEVLPENGVGTARTALSARIVPVDGDHGWLIKPVDALKHDDSGDAIDVTVAPGYLGNPDQWCWWEYEYPEDGVFGGYKTKELVLGDIERQEQRDAKCHYHVSVLVETASDAHYAQKHPQLRSPVPAGDVRRRGRSEYPSREKRARKVLGELSGRDGRRFFTVDFVQRAAERDTRTIEERTTKLRVALIGVDPHLGYRHVVVVERCELDAMGNESWLQVSGSQLAEIAVYWLLRRLVGALDTHAPLAKIGVIHEVAGDIQGPNYEFVPSAEQ
jgi:hypothetical protein